LAFPDEARTVPKDFMPQLKSLQDVTGPQLEPIAAWTAAHEPKDPEPDHFRQKWWTSKVHDSRKEALAKAVLVRDHCRLKLQGWRHTTAWMLTLPNEGMGSRFGGAEYRTLLRWWLGVPLLEGDGGIACPCCGTAMDPFGDHLVSCKYNKLTQRHHAVRDALIGVLRANGLGCRSEVAIVGRERPADVALLGFDPQGPVAVDLVGHHPLAPGQPRDPTKCGATVAEKEMRKNAKSAALCRSAGWLFSALGFHMWGGVGPQGSGILNRIVKQIFGDSRGWIR
jgi:hypothetical protein